MVVMLGPVRPVRPIRSVATVVVASQGNPTSVPYLNKNDQINNHLRESDALVVVPSPLLVRLWHRQSDADQARKKNERNLQNISLC